MEVWPFIPQVGFSEALEWKTDIQKCRAAEYRVATRPLPRQEFSYTHLLTETQFGRAKALAKEVGSDNMLLPVWKELFQVASLTTAATSITLTPAGSSLRAGTYLVIWESDTKYEVHAISSTGTNVVNLSVGLTQDFTTPYVLPIVEATLLQAADAERSDYDVVRLGVRFRTVTPVDKSNDPRVTYPTYLGIPVVNDTLELNGGIAEQYSRSFEEVDTGTGAVTRFPVFSTPEQTSKVTWTTLTVAQRQQREAWLFTQKGMQKSFWLPSWNADVTAVLPLGDTDMTLSIVDVNIRGTNQFPFYLAVRTTAGVFRYLKVLSAAADPVLPNVEVLTLAAPVPVSIALAEIELISRLVPSRFAADRIELQFSGGGDMTVSIPVVECPLLGRNTADGELPDPDPFARYVGALLHFEEDFTDEVGTVWAPMVPIAPPSVGHPEVQPEGISDLDWLPFIVAPPVGKGCLLTGLNNNYSVLGIRTLEPVSVFGTGDFTVECWVQCSATGSPSDGWNFVMGNFWPDNNPSTQQGWAFSVSPEHHDMYSSLMGYADVYFFANGWQTPIGPQIEVGHGAKAVGPPRQALWTHLAFSRVAGVGYFCVGGVLKSATACTENISTPGMGIGSTTAWQITAWRGKIDEVRITVGVGRYTTNFTPSRKPFTLE